MKILFQHREVFRTGENVSHQGHTSSRRPQIHHAQTRKDRMFVGGGKGVQSHKIPRFTGNRGKAHDSGKRIFGAVGKLPPESICLVKTEGLALDAFL